jgi:tRNA(fMet)-specific endonuclease VapC
LLALHEDEIATLSAITVAEIRYGLAKRPEATALKSLLDGFLNGVKVLPWSCDEAEVHGRLRAKLEKSGPSLGNMDMTIGVVSRLDGTHR